MVAEVQSSISDDVLTVVDFLLELSVSEVVTDAEHLSSKDQAQFRENGTGVEAREKGDPDFSEGEKINRRQM